MNAIPGLGSRSTNALQQQPATGDGQFPLPLQARIETALDSQGLDAATRESLKVDLQNAIRERFESGRTSRDDIKSAVQDVLQQYGLDPELLAGRLDPGATFGGLGVDGSAQPSFLDLLQRALAGADDENTAASANEAAEYLLNALLGFEAEA